MVIFVRNKGVILFEVKTTNQQVPDAMKQLNRMQDFVNLMFAAATSNSTSVTDAVLPVSKVVCLPDWKKVEVINKKLIKFQVDPGY